MDYFEERDGAYDVEEKAPDTTRTSSEIQRFFEGKSVFITGATGLIGGLLLENLLREIGNEVLDTPAVCELTLGMDYFEERDGAYDVEEKAPDTTRTSSEIQRFFEGKSVFITGATGLIGGLLLENLLRTCPKINKIYILMRGKKGQSQDDRLNNMFASEVFWKVKRIHKDPKEKVQIIVGDISLPWCGISESDKQLIIENVDIVYHAAAALRMDEHIRASYYNNVQATEHLLEIGTQMKRLKAFIYVSTAYCNFFLPDISEKFYETEYNAEELKTLVSLLDDQELSAIMPKVIGRWTNSYCFTKAIAETVTRKYSEFLPVAVARPSIVIGCEKEPLISWINNVYGPTGVSLAAGLGLMRVWHGSNDKVADIIPADKVVTALVAIAWQVGKYHETGRKLDVPVFNILSSVKSPQTWKDYMTYTEYYAKSTRSLSKNFVRPYDFHIEERYWLYKCKVWANHLLFGIIVDSFMKLKDQKPMLIKGFIKIYNFNHYLVIYTTREWASFQQNMDKLWSEMSNQDRKIFNFDMTNFNWKNYHLTTIRGIVIYILKDDLSHIETTWKKFKRMEAAIKVFKIGCFGAATYFLRNFIYSAYGIFSKFYTL